MTEFGREPREHDAARAPGPVGLPGPALGWRGGVFILAFWTLYGMVTTGGLLFSPLRETGSVPGEFLAAIFLGAYTWAALTLPLFWLTRRFRLEEDRAWRAAALLGSGVAIAALVSVGVAAASWLVLAERLPSLREEGESGVWQLARFRFLTDLLACLLILCAGLARDYFLRYRARELEASQLRGQLVEARLKFLRAQLNPHFLSNTMNAVSALVSKDPRAVRRMLARLSELLRYTLEAPSEPEIRLEQELSVLQLYLEILEIRFQGRLRTRVEADPDVLDALVPNLILQPLAENAMEHGVSQAAGYGAIEVLARRDGERLILTVRDTGASEAPEEEAEEGTEPERDRTGGYGLRHARDRLEQLYGSAARMTLVRTPEGGMRAEIALPFRTAPATHAGAPPPRPAEHSHA